MVLSKIVTFVVVAVFLSLFFSGFQITQEPVKLVPFDVVFLVFSAVTLFILFFRGIHTGVAAALFPAFFLILLMLIWHIICLLRSQDIARAITMLMILIRDMVVMVLISVMISNQLLNRKGLPLLLFVISVLISLFVLPLFIMAAIDPAQVAAKPYPGLIYRAGEGLFPHLQGFNHNPIYFATLLLLSVVTGLSVCITEKRCELWIKVGLLILIACFFMTFQRGPVIVFVTGMVAMISILLPLPVPRRFFVKYIHKFLFLFLVVFTVLLILRLPGYEFPILQRMLYRFQRATWELRPVRWLQILSSADDTTLIVGHGLRGAEILVGGQFVESSYVEILYDQGIVGFIVWSLFFIYILSSGIKKLRKDAGILPWCWGWLLILISMGYISMHYDPLTWVVAGIIAGWRSTALTLGTLRRM